MRRITETCPELNYRLSMNSTGDIVCSGEVCGKELRITFEAAEYEEGEPTGRLYQVLKCGHSRYIDETKWNARPENTRNSLWNKLLPKQQEAVKFVEETNFNCYLDMQMGTGKTPVSLSVLRENMDTLLPCLIITEAGDIHRWQREAIKWLGLKNNIDPSNPPSHEQLMEIMSMTPQVLNKNGANQARLSKITITSWTNIKDEKFIKMLHKHGYKCIIADEAHMFKNEDSARSQAFIKLCTFIPHRLFLSGTWIENNLEEAFVPLNVLDPKYFNSREALASHCVISEKGKILSLHPYRRDYFFRRIAKYVFRLTKEELGVPLPRLFSYSRGNRDAVWISPQDFKGNNEHIKEYNDILDTLEMELSKDYTASTIIGLMSQLRHAVGKMKVRGCVEYVISRMTVEMEPGSKICIGVHHKSVMTWLKQLLETVGFEVLTMSDEDALTKDAIENEFKNNPRKRILIASILGAGKGRNLQFCQNFVVLERQWNRSKEVQFEERFHRIKTDPQTDEIIRHFTPADDVVGDYLMASKSFDEYFDALVKLKGEIVKSIDSAVADEDAPEPNFVLELARMCVTKRMAYVGM